jgi:hypothetical protein
MSREIVVDAECVLSRYAQLHGRRTRRPVAALGEPLRTPALFAEDELVVDAADRDLVGELRERYDAEVVEEAPLPPMPELLGRRREVDLEGMPSVVRLRFRRAPEVDDREALLARLLPEQAEPAEQTVITSELAASLAALTVQHTLDGREIGLNVLGRPFAMPLSTAQEGPVPGAGSNPFAYQAFAGRTRMVEAWQLVDSVRRLRGDRLITVAVLDEGFWLDGNGVPQVSPAQASSDFPSFIQLNLRNESIPAGGAAPSGFAWHGNCVASVATAVVGNSVGAAGSAGNVATPFLLRSDFSVTQILRCVKICAAWGIDVLNMSFGIWGTPEISFPTSLWDKTFQFAFDHDVVMVAAAGNFGQELPDGELHVRPATRTPGVLTVGALDTNDGPRSDSDYGSSVWLWAPGTGIPVAPFPSAPQGATFGQTSAAAPVVAGVAAMMRYLDDGMSAADIRRTLVDTGWPGTGRVSRGLDAYAAVLASVEGVLPDTDEPNNTPATARDLLPVGAGGALTPWTGGFSTRSHPIDPDFWRFRVDRHSTVTVEVDWYDRLGTLFAAVVADDPRTHGPDDMGEVSGPGRRVLSGLLPPGGYQVRIGGVGVTAYRLSVRRTPAPLDRDLFEENDSFERAARMSFQASGGVRWRISEFGPGTYDATLHAERGVFVDLRPGRRRPGTNDDYFRFDVPAGLPLTRPTISVTDSDLPVDLTLYDAAQTPIGSWPGVTDQSIRPPVGATCYLKVSGTTPTRYRLTTRMAVDRGFVPELRHPVQVLPQWWLDPPAFSLEEVVNHYVFEVTRELGADPALAFERPAADVELELLSPDGEVLGHAEEVGGRLYVDTTALEAGAYVLRVTRPDGLAVPPQLRVAAPLIG